MKKFFILFLLLVLTGCEKKVLYRADSGKTFSYTLGSQFSVVLSENPTTGYRWRLKTVPDSQMILTLSDDHFEPHKKPRVGSGGYHVFNYGTVNKGQVELQAFHARPWVSSEQEVPAVTYTIIVR